MKNVNNNNNNNNITITLRRANAKGLTINQLRRALRALTLEEGYQDYLAAWAASYDYPYGDERTYAQSCARERWRRVQRGETFLFEGVRHAVAERMGVRPSNTFHALFDMAFDGFWFADEEWQARNWDIERPYQDGEID